MLTSLVLAVVGGDLYGAAGGHLGELKGIPRTLPITSKSNIYEVFFLFKIGTSVRRSSGRRSGVAVRAVDCWQ